MTLAPLRDNSVVSKIKNCSQGLVETILKRFALLKRILKTHSRLIYRICTQKMRVLPDFFVLGPPRSGTSSLYHYLGQHPSYVRPFMKELAYSVDRERIRSPHGQFNQDLYQYLPEALRKPLMWSVQGLFYHNGADGYRKLFPLASEMKKTAQKHGKAITGEFSVFGLYDAAAAEDFPYCVAGDRTKFITILRNPADFLFSYYTLETNAHFRQVNRDVSFDRFLHHPEELYADDNIIRRQEAKLRQWLPLFEQYPFFDKERYSFTTFLISYVVFIKHWAHSLPRDRFLVLNFADLCNRSQETMNTVFEFLEIPGIDIPDMKPVNANEYNLKISQQAATYIKEVARPYNEELYEFLGHDLGWE